MISPCPACYGKIEFPDEDLGSASECPYCGQAIILQPPPPSKWKRCMETAALVCKRFWNWPRRDGVLIAIGVLLLLAGIVTYLHLHIGLSYAQIVATGLLMLATAAGITIVVIFTIYKLWTLVAIIIQFLVGVLMIMSGTAALFSAKLVFQEQTGLMCIIGGCGLIALGIISMLLREISLKLKR